jgi:hypothetical protein
MTRGTSRSSSRASSATAIGATVGAVGGKAPHKRTGSKMEVGDRWNAREPRTQIVVIGTDQGTDEAALRGVFEGCHAAKDPSRTLTFSSAEPREAVVLLRT